MESVERFTAITALIGEAARATMLWSLLDGRAYTAGELALSAGISPQSASNHLNKLVEGGLLRVEKQGKHRYYCFARHEVAYAIEGLASLVPEKRTMMPAARLQNGDVRYARTCYDHLAGNLAVNITQGLVRKRLLQVKDDTYLVSQKGIAWFAELSIDVHALQQQKRAFAQPCLDWSERRHHLAGALGAALLDQLVARHWVRRKINERTVILTAKGQQVLERLGLIDSAVGNQ
ncbi:ArsR/SmtB family transcription factor [Paraflavitalea pollutisoli]|uniref:ArsR/SmtB family transcription factor n=1 Tax=Paraflavitalea pollutisoli TaxID=3034143 RepID=UPI0023EAF2EC|nr:helix-turn-helix transcriptional regulator [Paraflavitalea sp. H1-2-19X]